MTNRITEHEVWITGRQWADDTQRAYNQGAVDMEAKLHGFAADAYREGWCAGVVGGMAAAVIMLVAVAIVKAWC